MLNQKAATSCQLPASRFPLPASRETAVLEQPGRFDHLGKTDDFTQLPRTTAETNRKSGKQGSGKQEAGSGKREAGS
jgi:hypothetical protein